MKKGSIGEFAKHKVGRLIDWLEGKDTTNEKEALYLLNNIGDHNAAAQLKRVYDEKKYKDCNSQDKEKIIRKIAIGTD